jgi:hypothetical protein
MRCIIDAWAACNRGCADACGQLDDMIVERLRYDPDQCRHERVVILAGRYVCNSGCGADLGPAS